MSAGPQSGRAAAEPQPAIGEDARPHSESARPLYHGWLVVAGAFLIALFGWGFGFYAPGIYLVTLEHRHGWSATEISFAITAYYLSSATLVFFAGAIFARLGVRAVVGAGCVAMAAGAVLLTLITQVWETYAGFALMSVGWAAMGTASINIIVAPWFDRRRGRALSVALIGASFGGVVVAPLLIVLIERLGFLAGVSAVAALMLAIVLPIVLLVLRARRPDERDRADEAPPHAQAAARSAAPTQWSLLPVLKDWDFQTISIPFALGLLVQVGFVTHQVAYLSTMMSTVAAGWAVSLTTAAAVVGRLIAGAVVDSVDRRAAACANFAVQIAGIAVLIAIRSPLAVYLGCILFGLGIGNMATLPALIVQREFPKEHFARIVSLVVAINQYTFAFGPGLIGYLQRIEHGYVAAFVVCIAVEAIAAIIVVLPLLRRRQARAPRK
jgi:MFS family permease